MRDYTQGEIDRLISCPKRIVDPPRQDMRREGGHLRNDMRLQPIEGPGEFRVFIRINTHFKDNFSIGLAFNPRDGSGEFILLRCNGPHGAYNDSFYPEHPHFGFHIHRATEDALRTGIRAEKNAQSSDAFDSFDGALQYFLNVTNIVNAGKYFPPHRQIAIEFGNEEPQQ